MDTIVTRTVALHPPTLTGLRTLRRPIRLPTVPPAAKELADLRDSAGLSQPVAAAAIGVTASHLSRVESGQRRLRLRQALLLQSIYLNYREAASPTPTPVVPARPIAGGSDQPTRATAAQLKRLAELYNGRRLH